MGVNIPSLPTPAWGSGPSFHPIPPALYSFQTIYRKYRESVEWLCPTWNMLWMMICQIYQGNWHIYHGRHQRCDVKTVQLRYPNDTRQGTSGYVGPNRRRRCRRIVVVFGLGLLLIVCLSSSSLLDPTGCASIGWFLVEPKCQYSLPPPILDAEVYIWEVNKLRACVLCFRCHVGRPPFQLIEEKILVSPAKADCRLSR